MNNLILFSADFLAMFIAIVSVALLSGLISGVSFKDEASIQDNPAFGISVAGQYIGMAFLLVGVYSGEYATGFVSEFISMLSYLITGIIFMFLSRVVFDRFILTKVNLEERIRERSVPAAIITAANVISASIIMMSVMYWIDTGKGFWGDLPVIFAHWVACYAAITLVSMAYRKVSNKLTDTVLQQEIGQGELAPAISYGGVLVGLSLAVSNLGELVQLKMPAGIHWALESASWFVLAVLAGILLLSMTYVIKRIALKGIEFSHEVMIDKNVGVASINAAIFISTAVILRTLFGG